MSNISSNRHGAEPVVPKPETVNFGEPELDARHELRPTPAGTKPFGCLVHENSCQYLGASQPDLRLAGLSIRDNCADIVNRNLGLHWLRDPRTGALLHYTSAIENTLIGMTSGV